MTTPEEPADYGEAVYVAGRHRKNQVLVYTSRKDRNKVYEFMIATKYKIPGLVSWKCVSCSKVKNGYRNLGAELKRKVPLILVDNDIIKEDPEKPLNAEHFCSGKDAVSAVLDRARFEFVHRYGNKEPSNLKIHATIHDFAREAASSTPIPLNIKEKRLVQRTLDAKCLPLLYGVNKRRRLKVHKMSTDARNEQIQQLYHPDEEAISEMGEGSSNVPPEEQPSSSGGPIRVARNEFVAESVSPRKQVIRRVIQRVVKPQVVTAPPQTLMVRPLPPLYGSRAHAPPSQAHQVHHRYQHHHPQNQHVEYYEEDEEEDVSEEALISGDQQQVAYSIEL